jgi:hypothetical protein
MSRPHALAAAVFAALSASAFAAEKTLPQVEIEETAPEPLPNASPVRGLKATRAVTSDTAALLRDVPGVQLNGTGGMGPGVFWNIADDERDRSALFAEWGQHLSESWMTPLGARFEQAHSDAGDERDYSTMPNAPGGQYAQANALIVRAPASARARA